MRSATLSHPQKSRPSPWMRLASLALLIVSFNAAAGSASAAERELEGSVHSGYRGFNEELYFNGEIGYGGRLMMRVDDRFAVGLDFELSHPLRVSTNRTATVASLRSLVRVDLLRSEWRPYLCGGLGILLFDFDDATDTAMGHVTGGGGIARRLGDGWLLYAEGTADLYRSEVVGGYDTVGEPIWYRSRATEFLGSVVLGIGRRF